MEKRLGLGLDAFFDKSDSSIKNLKLSEVKIAKWQPRKEFDSVALQELSDSIKRHGVIQPIIVKKINNIYELVAGERRLRASKLANLEVIPAIELKGDQDSLEVSMIENIQRKDLNPVEKADAFAFLIDTLKISHDELARRLGISRSMISNYLRINSLDADVKEKIALDNISFGHAKIIASKKNAKELVKKIVDEKLSVRDLEKLEKKKGNESQADIKRFEEMICDALDMKCEIEYTKNGGKIALLFRDSIEFEELVSKLCL